MASLVPGPPAAAHRLARNAPRPQTAPASHLRQPLNTEQVALPPQHRNYHLSSSHATSAGSPPSLSSQLHLHLPPKQVACHLSRQITSLSFDCSHVLAPQILAKFFLRYMCKTNCNSVAFSRSISQTSHVAGLHRRSTHSCSGLIMLLSVQQCIPPMHADSFVSRQKQVGGSCVGFHAFPILQVCKVSNVSINMDWTRPYIQESPRRRAMSCSIKRLSFLVAGLLEVPCHHEFMN